MDEDLFASLKKRATSPFTHKPEDFGFRWEVRYINGKDEVNALIPDKFPDQKIKNVTCIKGRDLVIIPVRKLWRRQRRWNNEKPF